MKMADEISMKGKGNILKVVELGLQDRIYEEMKKPKFSVEAITRQLNDEGHDITAQSIRKFIKKTKKAQQELISKDLSVANQVKDLTMDYSRALKDILKEVEEVKNMAKSEKDHTTYNQLIGRLFQGIELIAKLTGELKPERKQVDVHVIYEEISNDMNKKMSEFKKDFYKDTKVVDIDSYVVEEDLKVAEERR